MKVLIFFVLIIPYLAGAQSSDNELVRVLDLIPDVQLDLKYNTTDNFTEQKLYSTGECLLALGAVKQLILVQDSLRNIRSFNGTSYPEGLGLKIWDGYRPRAIQYLMWEIFPNPVYVANPSSGSIHNRGGAVDLTLVDLHTGEELALPTEFDYFGEQAHHDYPNLPSDVIANRELLRSMMTEIGGFQIYSFVWWHYTWAPSKAYPLLDFQMK